MSKFIKIKAVQCNEDGSFLFPTNVQKIEIIINTNIIKGIIQPKNICINEDVLKFPNYETYFTNLELINPSDLDELIIL